MRMHLNFVASAVVLIAVPVHAAQLYVDDKLVLNVYAEPSQSSARVATIETGDAVEELERVEKFVRVQLDDGREGWVGASYLSSEPPAIVRLKELQASLDADSQAPHEPPAPPKHLIDELARLKKQNGAFQTEIGSLKRKLSARVVVPAVAAAPTPAAHAEPEPVARPSVEPTIVIDRSYWWAWALAVGIAAGLGFFAGYQTLGKRVRERFGGVKVY